MLAEKHRCAWGQTNNDLMREYHDEEWGGPAMTVATYLSFCRLKSCKQV